MLKEILIKTEDLVLDPNNPRFVKDLSSMEVISDEDLANTESRVLNIFSIVESDGEDATNIKDLFDSMEQIGFVPIDKPVVRQIKNTQKYLVIEGNRRISTVKKIIDYLKPENIELSAARKVKFESHRTSFEEISCQLLVTDGLSEKEIEHRTSVILGLRHHGSLLEWEPLPRAYNIYTEYMGLSGNNDAEFIIRKNISKEVSARLSISPVVVKQCLRTYVIYLKLSEQWDVKPKHYSLIQAAVSNTWLATHYLCIDLDSCRLDDKSSERFNDLCQFSTRDQTSYKKKKIIPDPKVMGRFGSLIRKRENQETLESKAYISNQISQVLDVNQDKTVEEAVDNVNDYINRKQWVDALQRMMLYQKNKLDIDTYTGRSNDRMEKDRLSPLVKKIVNFLRS